MTNTQDSGITALQERLNLIAATMKGTVEYGFTNDYMFRAVLQKNPIVLTEIVRVLLKIPKSKTVACEILNPIILGKTLENKDCILDVLVSVNGKALVNLEMQMTISIDWIKRSLYYGFDMYTNLKAGQDYSDCKPSYHIGFVKRSPFGDDDRFYSNFLLMEEKNHRIYSRDFQISMINLSHIENATEEDRKSGLYDWVRMFKATEWKELMKMAQQSEILGSAIVTLAELSKEEQIQQQCAARRKYEMDEQAAAKRMQKITQERDEMAALLVEKDNQLTSLLKDTALREKLTEFLIQAERFDDLKRSIDDSEYRNNLIQELKLT